jgi:2-polyprenyl-3-methyl-5-hydroxy-6-metoxy-1,4-benzoquinol methylase
MTTAPRPTPADLDAQLYDLRPIGWPGELEFYRTLSASAGLAARVIEIACGTGRVAHPPADKGFAVIGIDVSAAMLSVARSRNRHHGGWKERP